MSLRFRLFLVLGALVAALVGAHGWLVRSLAGELTAELDVVALDVGASVARLLAEPPAPSCPNPPCPPVERRVEVLHLTAGEKLEERTITEEIEGRQRVVRHVVRQLPVRSGPDAAPGEDPDRVAAERRAGGPTDGYAYRFDVATAADSAGPGAGHQQTLVVRLDTATHGALKLQGPGLSAEVPIPRLGLQTTLAEFERRALLGSALLLLAGLAAAAYLAGRVAAPLLQLSRAAIAVGDGQLGLTVDERAGSSELRAALAAFNRMSARLAELSQQNRRLQQERHLGEIGEIARGLAHSLRNPLHALGLSVDEIAARAAAGPAGETEREEAGALAAAARRQIGRLDRSIRSFLVFASQKDVAEEKVDLGALAEDVALEALQDRPQSVKIEVDKEAGASLELAAVEQELRAMVQALVVNAVEASPPGATVVLRVGRAGERFRLEVDDQGEGLAPEVRDRLFTPHVTTKANGSGMGLFLAQRLAAGRYDGAIELLARSPQGTRARLEIGPRATQGERS